MEKKETVCSACHGLDVWHAKHMLIRWLLGIFILAIVFKVGMRIGEFKRDVQYGMFGGPHTYHMLQYGDGYSHGYNYSLPRMMPSQFQIPVQSPPPSPTPSPKPTKAP